MNAELVFRQALEYLPLLAILRGLRPQDAVAVGQALWRSGWRMLEVPLNSPAPLQIIRLLARAPPQALVGAGTVLSGHQVREVHQAGGRLIVSPHFDPDVVTTALKLGLVCLPGVLSPTEAFGALQLGASGLGTGSAVYRPGQTAQAVERQALLWSQAWATSTPLQV